MSGRKQIASPLATTISTWSFLMAPVIGLAMAAMDWMKLQSTSQKESQTSFFLLPPQCLEGTSGTDLGLLRSNLSSAYSEAQIHIYGHVTLRRLCCQSCILQSLEYLIEVSEVLVLVKAENLQVIHVRPAYSLMAAKSSFIRH